MPARRRPRSRRERPTYSLHFEPLSRLQLYARWRAAYLADFRRRGELAALASHADPVAAYEGVRDWLDAASRTLAARRAEIAPRCPRRTEGTVSRPEKIIRKSMYWKAHGHPVAMRGEYARMLREAEQRRQRRRRLAKLYGSVSELFRGERRR